MTRVWRVTASVGSLGPSIYTKRDDAFHDLAVREINWPGVRLTLTSYMSKEDH